MNNFTITALKTYPSISLKFKLIDGILEMLVMRFLNILSHHWHWENIDYSPEFDEFGILLEGAPSGNLHTNPFSGVVAHLGKRPYGYVVDADTKNGYFIGFRHKNSSHIRRCKIELNQPVMLLTAPDNGCFVYAMDINNRPVKLRQLTKLIHRKDAPLGVRIL